MIKNVHYLSIILNVREYRLFCRYRLYCPIEGHDTFLSANMTPYSILQLLIKHFFLHELLMGIIAYCATLHCAVLFLILYFPIQFCFVLVRFSLVYSVLYCSVPLHSLVFDFCFCIVLFVPLAFCSAILFCVVF